MTTKAEPWQIVLMLFNIDVIFTHFILLFSRFDIMAAYGLIKFCKKGVQRPLGAEGCGIAQRPRSGPGSEGSEGEGIAFGDEYIVSVTGLAFVSPVLHDEEQKPPS